jgi:hypothetical protein
MIAAAWLSKSQGVSGLILPPVFEFIFRKDHHFNLGPALARTVAVHGVRPPAAKKEVFYTEPSARR